MLVPKFEQIPFVKTMINIGAGLDIPTGHYIKGRHGESILNAGLGMITGVVGIGNNFKSTILYYIMLSAMDRIMQMVDTIAITYDTETNVHLTRLFELTKRFKAFHEQNILENGKWIVSDKTIYFANEWYEILRDYLTEKKKEEKKHLVKTPFLDRDGKSLMEILIPTFTAIDSFSEFETADVAKIQEENELGDSGGNMMHARQGLAKTRFLMDVPTLCGKTNHYLLMTAHIGKEMPLAQGPMAPPPTKKLQYLKNGDKLKGVTDKFTFLLSNCLHAFNATPLINQGTKGPEYPRNPDDNRPGDTDLNVVCLRQLRSKSGQSGYVMEVLVSQTEGVLPSLTEFHYIKSSDRFGISGTMQHYNLDLLPDVKLSRTTVRSKLDTNPVLARAVNITSELCQMTELWRHYEEGFFVKPAELYEGLKKKGYDWTILLNTRGWWTVNNDEHPVPFLSTQDLLNMYHGRYHPWWYPVKQEDLKPQS